jgi:hypothetical protein
MQPRASEALTTAGRENFRHAGAYRIYITFVKARVAVLMKSIRKGKPAPAIPHAVDEDDPERVRLDDLARKIVRRHDLHT